MWGAYTTSSPPSATIGSTLSKALAPVQKSSYFSEAIGKDLVIGLMPT